MSANADPQKVAAKLDVRFSNSNYGAARYGPKGVYHLPEDRTVTSRAYQSAVFSFLLTFVIALWAVTEVLAIRLHFDAALGSPLLLHIYAPWAGVAWMATLANGHFRSATFAHYITATVILGATLFTLGLIVSIVCAMRTYKRSLLSSRRPPDLRGSAHWASPTDLERMELIPKRG